MPTNEAFWQPSASGRPRVSTAPYTSPRAGEVVVRVRAVALNPIDVMPGLARRLLLPWLTYPTVLGSDVAGVVVDVGEQVARLRPGDRVVGHAVGIAKGRNRAADGAFQTHAVLLQHMVATIPDTLPFEQAAVLPLGLSTAASGLFQPDHLALNLPQAHAVDTGQTVLVWGGSTSVGSNGIQLARNAGYRVITTASAKNVDYVRELGAAEVVDYHAKDVVEQLVAAVGSSPLVGVLAIGGGSVTRGLQVAARTPGRTRVAAAQPGFAVALRQRRARRLDVPLSAIWGGSLKNNEVGPAVYVDFLSTALATGRYVAAPPPIVVGDGLEQITAGMRRLKEGMSAGKVVVTLTADPSLEVRPSSTPV
jgi:NADPH:quinone reductase-like Zn-dependent oxidoreductase